MLADILSGWPPPALDPAGPFNGPIVTLSWVLFAMSGVVLLVVLVATGLALFGGAKWKRRLSGRKLIWIGGLVFPTVVLSALLVYGLALTAHLNAEPEPGEMRVRVTGEMWWWRVAYLDAQGREVLQDANEVHIPAGRPVTFELESADVIHAFWVPPLGGKVDMIPGRRNILRLQADKPGAYGGQCAEYCGGPHALMGLVVVAHEPGEFERWRRSRRAAPAPSDALGQRGAQVFADSGCGACHTVRGSAANGLAGPDLTHVGSRRSLGAGILPNNRGTLAGWVADSQTIKPGNRMPAYKMLSGGDLQAVAAYLESLR
ncbi:cytochrome c oxidase subunit II [Caulobacter sp. NIBR2454]|uniref:cytochrome c oxidase subunit II n=1 Tax=Caulobacter sp. NIBR2454 TaxID=3015996 RepID=UPI0022B6FB69|nr:cytochrome c oxidase subunit II [Caulobacter sp. NIBR2454]